MAKFPGSPFFSDTTSLARQAFVSREYELPVFIDNKLLKCNPDRAPRQRLRRDARRYRNYYKCAQRVRPHRQPPDIDAFRCAPANPSDRFAAAAAGLSQLPPNRYHLTDHCLSNIVGRSAGRRGPYDLFTGPRDDSTLRGHTAPSKCRGSRTMFYDIPPEMQRLQQPSQYFRYQIREGQRFAPAVAGNPLLWPHRQSPGPTAYYPKVRNIVVREPRDMIFRVSSSSHHIVSGNTLPYSCPYPQNYTLHVCQRRPWRPAGRKQCASFFRSSCVPTNDRFNATSDRFQPGPGRYSPDAVACPCPRGTSYSAERQRLLEALAARHTGRVPGQLAMRMCAAPLVRNVRGHGHTWVFRSRRQRLLPLPGADNGHKPTTGQRGSVQLQLEHDAKYIRMITNPARTEISRLAFDLAALQLKPGRLRFNTLDRPLKRSKLRNNKKVAFNSSTPRWPVNALEQLLATKALPAAKLRRSPNIPHAVETAARRATPSWIARSTAAERLLWQPRRYVDLRPTVDRSNKMRYTFAALPPARILVPDALAVDETRLQKVNTALEVEELYTEEVLELKREWDVRKKLLGLK